MPLRRTVGIALTLVALAVAAPANATVRHAAPGASGDCVNNPCEFVGAVNGAQPGDEVIVATGDYGSEASAIPDANNFNDINVHGEAGKPRPRIFTSGQYGLGLYNPLAKVSHLEIISVDDAPNSSVALDFRGAIAEDLIVHNKNSLGFAACRLSGNAVLRSSVCWTPSIQNPPPAVVVDYQAGNSTPTIRNVTAVSLGSGASGVYLLTDDGVAISLTAVNSVIEGIVGVAYRENPPATGSGTATFKPTYSNIVGAGGNNFCNPTTDCTQEESDTNLLGNALFIDLAGNYHQDPMSPTINAGVTSAANGTKDFDGQPRTIGGKTDIGADELSLPPAVVTGSASGVTQRAGTISGTVNPKNVAGVKAHFVYGKTKAYGKRKPDTTLDQNATAQGLTGSLTGLAPGTRYHYRLVAGGPGGNGQGVDRTFKTKPAFKGLKLPKKQTVTVTDNEAVLGATCPSSAKAKCKGTLRLAKGKKPNVVSLGKLDFDIPKGKAKLAVPLNGRARDLLEKGKIKAKATAKTKDGSGGKAKKTSGKVTLKPSGSKAAAAR
jgi:hypothetical protein